MYDVIVIGATFAAAGIAHTYGKTCLILEPGLQAGNEFYGAIQFGSDFKRKPKREEAIILWEDFHNHDIYDRIIRIYPYLQQADVLFDIRPVSVQKSENGFVCTAHGAEGFSVFEAKQVIDTRSHDAISVSKTFNILIESKETPDFPECIVEKGGLENHYVLRIPMPLSQGYAEARAVVQKLVCRFSESQKLILSATVFDYQVKADCPEVQNGIRCLPSKAYRNPVLAFEAGLEVTL